MMNNLKKMHCPRDRAELKAIAKGQLDISSCPECKGFFVNLGQEPAKHLESLLSKELLTGDKVKDNGLISPVSGQPMLRFVYRGVELDYCKEAHAVWFDTFEYTQLFKAVSKEGKSQISKEKDIAMDIASEAVVDDSVFGAVGVFVDGLLSAVDIFDIG